MTYQTRNAPTTRHRRRWTCANARDQPVHAAAVEPVQTPNAATATMVAAIASSMAASFSAVGRVVNRVSIVAETFHGRRRAGQVGEHPD